MKFALVLLASFAIAGPVVAKAPIKKKKSSSSAPQPYPSIIQTAPAVEARGTAGGLIQSELSGRTVQFLKDASQAGREQLVLAELVKAKESSEQLKAVAETVGAAQATESGKVADLAAARHLALAPLPASARMKELAALSGAKFEKAWVEQLIATSEASVAAYESVLKSDDAELRGFAEKMLPVAQARLQIAYRLGGRAVPVKSGSSSKEGDAPRPIPPPVPSPAPTAR